MEGRASRVQGTRSEMLNMRREPRLYFVGRYFDFQLINVIEYCFRNSPFLFFTVCFLRLLAHVLGMNTNNIRTTERKLIYHSSNFNLPIFIIHIFYHLEIFPSLAKNMILFSNTLEF